MNYRYKIGLAVPASNTVMEPEFYAMVPRGASVHAARMTSGSGVSFIESIKEMIRDTEKAVKELSFAKVDVIVFGCTSGSFLGGPTWNENITERMARITNAKTVTASTAVVDALKCLGVKKVSVATPYINEINMQLKSFLELLDFEVIEIKGLNLTDVNQISEQSSAVAYKLAKSVNSEGSDGIFISCTDFRTIDIIETLEADVNKPVISSNQASMWKSLRLVKFKGEIKGFGSLFKKL